VSGVCATRTNDLGQPIGPTVPGWRPRPVPAPTELRGRYCRLVPLSVDHAAGLYAAVTDDTSGRQWTYLSYGPFDGLDEFAGFVAATIDNPAYVTLTVIDATTDAPLGWASYMRIDPSIGSVEVGGVTLGAALQRTAAATEAMYLMAAHAIEDLGYRRYEWKCDDLHVGSRAAAARLGFRYEGTWRNATVYKGRSRDTAWYAITDADWAQLGPVIREWLDPSNFADGRQLTALSELTARVRAELDA
jgi:RimJ/RimL family protein N-acetyltransferase